MSVPAISLAIGVAGNVAVSVSSDLNPSIVPSMDQQSVSPGDQQFRARILDDIGHFRSRQARGDGHIVKPRPLRGPANLEIPGRVLGEDRNRVAGIAASRPQRVRDPVGALVELLEGDRFAGAGHDDRRLVGMGFRVMERVHGGLLGATLYRRHFAANSSAAPRTVHD